MFVNGFFEWKAIEGLKANQPFAIAMRDKFDDPYSAAHLKLGQSIARVGIIRYADSVHDAR